MRTKGSKKNRKQVKESVKFQYHSCPYQEEIRGNYDAEYCDCDREKKQNCIDDI